MAEKFPEGAKVKSKYHGTGTVIGRPGGYIRILFDPMKKGKKKQHGGGEFNYTPDGRYFASGEFQDKNPVLEIVSLPKEEKET